MTPLAEPAPIAGLTCVKCPGHNGRREIRPSLVRPISPPTAASQRVLGSGTLWQRGLISIFRPPITFQAMSFQQVIIISVSVAPGTGQWRAGGAACPTRTVTYFSRQSFRVAAHEISILPSRPVGRRSAAIRAVGGRHRAWKPFGWRRHG
jgi:hypothetical protein